MLEIENLETVPINKMHNIGTGFCLNSDFVMKTNDCSMYLSFPIPPSLILNLVDLYGI